MTKKYLNIYIFFSFWITNISLVSIYFYGEALERNNLLYVLRWIGGISAITLIIMMATRGIFTIQETSENEERLKLLNKQKLQANLYLKRR